MFQPCSLALVPIAELFLPLGVLPSLSTIHTPTAPTHQPLTGIGLCAGLSQHMVAEVPALETLTVQQGPGGREHEK